MIVFYLMNLKRFLVVTLFAAAVLPASAATEQRLYDMNHARDLRNFHLTARFTPRKSSALLENDGPA
jgi:hypothetical protein